MDNHYFINTTKISITFVLQTIAATMKLKDAHSLGFPGGSDSKASASNAGDLGLIPGLGYPLEKEMATHSSILAWKIPWTEEPCRL